MRSINQIQTQILATKSSLTALSGLTSTSNVSIYNLWSYVQATAIYVQEGLWEVFKTNIETDIANAPIGTDRWLQTETYKFQYDATTPQIVTLSENFVPSYAIIDETKQILSRASVKTLSQRTVSVKVAKNEPPVVLTSPELTSLQGYLNQICFAGVHYAAVSYTADKLMVGATVYYDGQYSATVTADTITAINNYLTSLPFDEYVKITRLEDAIQNAPGVTDVVMNNVALRPDIIPFSATTYLVQSNKEYFRQYPTYAGYAVSETEPGFTLNNTLTFQPE